MIDFVDYLPKLPTFNSIKKQKRRNKTKKTEKNSRKVAQTKTSIDLLQIHDDTFEYYKKKKHHHNHHTGKNVHGKHIKKNTQFLNEQQSTSRADLPEFKNKTQILKYCAKADEKIQVNDNNNNKCEIF